MTCNELKYEIKALQNMLKSKQDRQAKVIEEIRQIMEKADITVSELVNGLGGIPMN
ncbi:hypothetical protein [Vibrio sp.]|uniref:hypothetical protein n=1 Tax=Vibrio sp. TaxID=678 RepID=UPI003AA8EC8D